MGPVFRAVQLTRCAPSSSPDYSIAYYTVRFFFSSPAHLLDLQIDSYRMPGMLYGKSTVCSAAAVSVHDMLPHYGFLPTCEVFAGLPGTIPASLTLIKYLLRIQYTSLSFWPAVRDMTATTRTPLSCFLGQQYIPRIQVSTMVLSQDQRRGRSTLHRPSISEPCLLPRHHAQAGRSHRARHDRAASVPASALAAVNRPCRGHISPARSGWSWTHGFEKKEVFPMSVQAPRLGLYPGPKALCDWLVAGCLARGSRPRSDQAQAVVTARYCI